MITKDEAVLKTPILPLETKQDVELCDWVSNRLKFDPHSNTSMEDLYTNYYLYHEAKKFESLPLKRKTFAAKLKKNFRDKIFNNEIKFHYDKFSQVIGVSINNNLNYGE